MAPKKNIYLREDLNECERKKPSQYLFKSFNFIIQVVDRDNGNYKETAAAMDVKCGVEKYFDGQKINFRRFLIDFNFSEKFLK